MTINDRVLHHTEAGCTDPQRAGVITEQIDGGYAVKWQLRFPSGLETHYTAWYEPQELVLFTEIELEQADKQRELVFSFNQVIEEEKESA